MEPKDSEQPQQTEPAQTPLTRTQRVVRYGAWILGFGISFWQAALVSVIGIVVSFFLCGVIAIAGKRGSAPTMVLPPDTRRVIGTSQLAGTAARSTPRVQKSASA